MSKAIIETKYDSNHIQQKLSLDHGGFLGTQQICNHVISLKDNHVINALIKLGWTPPAGHPGT